MRATAALLPSNILEFGDVAREVMVLVRQELSALLGRETLHFCSPDDEGISVSWV